MNENLWELWGQTLLGMAKVAKGPQGFFDLFQNGFAKTEPKPNTVHEQFLKLCQETFGSEGIEKFNEVMMEFYENAGVAPRSQYNELHEKYIKLQGAVRELEDKIEDLKKKIERGISTPHDLMESWTETVKEYSELNQQFFNEFSKFFEK